MPLEPLHPDEPALHHALRDALNQRLTSTDFFVWISITPTGAAQDFRDLNALVDHTERWLAERRVDTVEANELPELQLSDPAAEVRIRAVPKKPAARGRRAPEIVGNPEPALAGWGA
jgi:hypothetical protein